MNSVENMRDKTLVSVADGLYRDAADLSPEIVEFNIMMRGLKTSIEEITRLDYTVPGWAGKSCVYGTERAIAKIYEVDDFIRDVVLRARDSLHFTDGVLFDEYTEKLYDDVKSKLESGVTGEVDLTFMEASVLYFMQDFILTAGYDGVSVDEVLIAERKLLDTYIWYMSRMLRMMLDVSSNAVIDYSQSVLCVCQEV